MTAPRVHLQPLRRPRDVRAARWGMTFGDVDPLDMVAPLGTSKARKIASPIAHALVEKARNAVGPLASEVSEKVRKGIEAWHGSPHKFDKFDLGKIGTGEGAQAYGHGLYFAENPEVATMYRAVGEPSHRNAGVQAIVRDAMKEAKEMGLDGPAAKAAARESIYRQAMERPDYSRRQWFDAMNNLDDVLDNPAGHTYRVNLDVDPDELLDWDAPLSKQSEKVRKLLQRENYAAADDATREGSGFYNALTDIAGDPAEASADLARAGIPGIRYLDGGSRAAGEGTRNYVIFDPERIKILERMAVAGTLGFEGRQELKRLKEAQPPSLPPVTVNR